MLFVYLFCEVDVLFVFNKSKEIREDGMKIWKKAIWWEDVE